MEEKKAEEIVKEPEKPSAEPSVATSEPEVKKEEQAKGEQEVKKEEQAKVEEQPVPKALNEENRVELTPEMFLQAKKAVLANERPLSAGDSPEEQIMNRFVIIETTPAGGDVNTSEIYSYWKAQKEQYAILKEWEYHRRLNIISAKGLLDNVCESIFTSLLSAVTNNKSIYSYFSAIAASLKEFGRQMSRVPETMEQLVEFHAKADEPMTGLFRALGKCDQQLSRNALEFAKHIDTVILPDLKAAMGSYTKNVNAQKEIYPKLSKAIDEAEKRTVAYFNSYSNAVGNKEMQILGAPAGDVDLWVPFHQYVLGVRRQSDNVMKYAQFCENLIEDRRNLETTRVDSCNKCLEKYLQQYKISLGQNELFSSFLPSIYEMDVKKVSEEIIMLEVSEEGGLKNVSQYKTVKLEIVKEWIKEKIELFRPMPDLDLVDQQCEAKRPAGFFSGGLKPCILVLTKDKYLHVLDSEYEEKPEYSFNLKKSQAKQDEDEKLVIEIAERKRKASLIDRLYSSGTCKIQFGTEKAAREWVEKINNEPTH